MDRMEAKQLVIEAGHRLVSSGLIARTWGNVSCRLDRDWFVITPSGRNYLTLTPDEVVAVRASDLSHQGSIAPSSETRIHAAVYLQNPNTNFIIHTHQENASVFSALGAALPVQDSYVSLLGHEVPCATYGLPGTKKLCRATTAALGRTSGSGVLMQRHGVLCTGRTSQEAFSVSAALEEVAGHNLALLHSPSSPANQVFPHGREPTITGACAIVRCRRADNGVILTTRDQKEHLLPPGCSLPGLEREWAVLDRVFQDHPELFFAEASTADPVLWVISQEKALKTWLDDFAQMVGPELPILPPQPEMASRWLRYGSAVLLRNMGALCFGSTESDAQAARQLLEKNCRTMEAALLFAVQNPTAAKPKPIPFYEAVLMRRNYLKKYSKRY